MEKITIPIKDIWDMMGGPGCGDWMQFCEDNKDKYNEKQMIEEYEKHLLSKQNKDD